MLGKTLSSRYQIIQHLGGGGFGQTYLAQDLQLPSSPLRVVKQLKPKSTNPDTLETARVLFEREAQALYQLGNHTQIPQLIADFEEDEQFFLVQEFIEGNELKQELRAGKQLREIQVIDLLKEILEILEFVHDRGVIHRDIKPSNLIRRKQDGKLVLIDFGAVKQVSTQITDSETQTTLTVAIGSPGFMPNEQLSGKPRFCSDIYAVGMLGIQALTGIPASQLPEDPRTSEIIWRIREALPVEVDIQVSQQLADVLDKMVRYDYRQRFQTATEAIQALERMACSTKASLTHPCLSKQTNSSATHTLHTLRRLPTSTQTTVTATLPPRIPSSKHQITPSSPGTSSLSPVDSEAHNAGVAASPSKFHKLKGFGLGIVTTMALTAGISQVPSTNFLSTNGLLAGRQNNSLVNTLTGHSKQVYAIAISPDGQTLVSGSLDNTLKLWNIPKGKPLRTLSGHSNKVRSVVISPDGQKIASGSWDGTIKLWNLPTGQVVHTLKGHSAGILSVAISPDGQTLASSSADKTVKVWNLRTGKLLRTLSGHSSWVYSVAISPDGQTLADGSDDRTIKLWHLPTGRLITTLSDPSGNVVRSVTFSPDGKTLVSGSFNKINLWSLGNLLTGCKDARTCRPMQVLSANLGIVESVAISPDGQTLASGSKDKTIKFWNLQTGKLKNTFSELSDKVNSLTFSPDSKTLISGGNEDGAIEIWRSP
jgi:WD40 repeat protein/tRNA A-37 threonylcarbamoyl transferase component Bud32